jgi:N-glycosidase YbiA
MIVNGKERDYIVHDAENVKGFFGEYRWMSNFHKCAIWYEGLGFPSTENAYVYAKIDPSQRKNWWELSTFLMSCEPHEAKKIGRTIPLRDDWEEVKYDVMSSVVFDKFYRHVDLRHELLATGDKYLEETNHWGDKFWGVCDGKGKNSLGKILMGVRAFWASAYPELVIKNKPTKLF